MAVDVLSPTNEDGTTATILRWLKKPGDRVQQHEPLLELETDKVTVEVAAPADGELSELLAAEGDRVEPGAVLARLDSGSASAEAIPPPAAQREGAQGGAAATAQTSSAAAPAPAAAPAAQAARAAPSSAADKTQSKGAAESERGSASQLLSPAVRRMAAEKGIDAAQLAGSGKDGRVTARDLEGIKPAGSRRIPHTAMRRRIAERMSESVATAPHVTSVFEVDMSRAIAHREATSADFAARGTKLTLTAYFVAAAAEALRAVPEVNASYHDDALELHGACNIGIGTALKSEGLIVPVVRNAETLDLFGIASELQRLTSAARAGTLSGEALRGGTFSISNHGVSGSLFASPIIIVQPQVAILGIGKLTRRLVVQGEGADERLVIRPMCYVTLTIDHRALDGFQANAFLSALVRVLEQWPPPAQ